MTFNPSPWARRMAAISADEFPTEHARTLCAVGYDMVHAWRMTRPDLPLPAFILNVMPASWSEQP